MANTLIADITAHLNTRQLYPTSQWLQTFVSTIRPNTPLPSLKSTAAFRLLATDITNSVSQPPGSVFPHDILNGTRLSRILPGPILCQVLDIEDIGQSRWSQVEAIEAQERGETTKGREIVRVVPEESENNNSTSPAPNRASKGPFKLLLQDAKGVQAYAFDLNGIEGVNTSMAMGVKLVVRNVDIRRGVVMLEKEGVQVLGGRIEALDKAWKEGRKERLMAAARAGGGD